MEFGVDEAGKGPVLGSMFAAAIRAPKAELPEGIDDSKRLSARRREAIADRLRESPRVEIGIAEITPARIDAGNMNDLTVSAHASAAEIVVQPGDSGLCDAGDVDAGRFGTRVESRIETFVSVDAMHRADESDPLVGAASIIAKSEREAHVDSLCEQFGEVGSGYPSDSTTRTFLSRYFRDHGEFPPPTRLSWSTCGAIRSAVEQTELGDH
ncbi:ribonuclease HII [Natronomonas sp.]|uniref:ribonuclease HII n=1 Tax=Natronomonas sp. TaxID=2184060 RepID=UPI0039753DE0